MPRLVRGPAKGRRDQQQSGPGAGEGYGPSDDHRTSDRVNHSPDRTSGNRQSRVDETQSSYSHPSGNESNRNGSATRSADDVSRRAGSSGRTTGPDQSGSGRADRDTQSSRDSRTTGGTSRTERAADRAERTGGEGGSTGRDRAERAGERASDRRTDRAERTSNGSDRTDRTDRRSHENNHDGRPDRAERTGEYGGNRNDANGDPRAAAAATSSSHLRTFGPVVSRFDGTVDKVFASTQRSKPSSKPIVAALAILVIAAILPFVIAYLPVIIIGLVGLMWLGKKGFRTGGRPRPRFGQDSQEPGLQITNFRVKIPRDEDARMTFRIVTCRLVQKVQDGSVPFGAGDRVSGSGRKSSSGVVEVGRLSLADGTTISATNPKSATPIAVLSLIIIAGAGGLVYSRWGSVPAVSWESVLTPLISAILPFLVIWFILKRLFR
jgi:hypothetical protein